MRYNHHEFVGETFGVLTVIGVRRKVSASGYTKPYLVCRCICGNTTEAAISDLLKEKVKSCGKQCHICQVTFGVLDNTKVDKDNKVINRFRTIWHDMKRRCDNPHHPEYRNYGGRGITYDSAWVVFANFYIDMFQNYEDTLTLDRIDVDGDYAKDNCRWENRTVQSHNRRAGGSSSYIGVAWDKSRNKWLAHICKGGDRRYLGRFTNELDAARAYDNASEELYGDRPNKTEP